MKSRLYIDVKRPKINQSKPDETFHSSSNL